MGIAGSIAAKIALDNSGFNKALKDSENATKNAAKNISKSLKDTGKKMQSVGKGMTKALTLPLAGLAGISLKTSADIETMKTSFESLLGSGEAAGAMVKELTQFTAKTPFQLNGVGNAAKKLLAVGVASENVQNKLKTIGDIAAGAGVPLNEMASIYGKIKSKGKAMTEEILQMSDRGIPIIQVLADQFGVAKDQVFEMASQSQISFQDIEKAMGSMTGKSGIYFNQMAKQSNTLAGLWSTLIDNLKLGTAALGDSIVKTFNLKEVMKGLISNIQKVVKWFKDLSDTQRKIIVIIGAVAAAIGPLLVVFGTLLTVLPALSASFATFWTALTGPVGLVIAKIAAVMAILVILYKKVEPFRSIVDNIWAGIKQLWEYARPAFVQFGGLLKDIGTFLFNYMLLPFRIAFTAIKKVIKAFEDTGKKAKETSGFLEFMKGAFDKLETALKAIRKIFQKLNEVVTNWQYYFGQAFNYIKIGLLTLVKIMIRGAELMFAPYIAGINAIIKAVNFLAGKSIPTLSDLTTSLKGSIQTQIDAVKDQMAVEKKQYQERKKQEADIRNEKKKTTQTVKNENEKQNQSSNQRTENEKSNQNKIKQQQQQTITAVGTLAQSMQNLAGTVSTSIDGIWGNVVSGLGNVQSTFSKKFMEIGKSVKEAGELTKEHAAQIAAAAVDMIAQVAGTADKIIKDMFKSRLERMKENKEKEIEAIDKSYEVQVQAAKNRIKDEEELQAYLTTLEQKHQKEKTEAAEKYNKEQARLKRKQAIYDKMMKIFMININAAAAIMMAFAQLGPIGGAIAAAVIGTIAAVQTAIVAATPVPKMAEGGIATKETTAIIGEEGEEAVLPLTDDVFANLAENIIAKLGEITSRSRKDTAIRKLERTTPGESSGPKTLIIKAGMIIADRSGLTELERRLRNIRISESNRMGLQYEG